MATIPEKPLTAKVLELVGGEVEHACVRCAAPARFLFCAFRGRFPVAVVAGCRVEHLDALLGIVADLSGEHVRDAGGAVVLDAQGVRVRPDGRGEG